MRIMVRKPADLLPYLRLAHIKPTNKDHQEKSEKQYIKKRHTNVLISMPLQFLCYAYKTKMQTATIRARITTTNKLSLRPSP